MSNPTGRLTKTDFKDTYYKSIFALPLDNRNAQKTEQDTLEFFEWLNHMGFSRRAYRSLGLDIRGKFNYMFSKYARDKTLLRFPINSGNKSFTEFLLTKDLVLYTFETKIDVEQLSYIIEYFKESDVEIYYLNLVESTTLVQYVRD